VKLILTDHARERAKLFRIPEQELSYMLENAEKHKITKTMWSKKRKRWGNQDNVYFRRFGNILFTLKNTRTGPVVITVTDMRINLRS